MKKFYAMLVKEEQTADMERVLNRFRIGLNDWDRTRTLYSNGKGYVNYTIICTEDTFESIRQIIKGK